MPTHAPVEMNRTFHQLESVWLVYNHLMSFCDPISRLRLMQTSHHQLDCFSLNDDDPEEIDSDERLERFDVKKGYLEYRRDKQRRIAKEHYLLALKSEIIYRSFFASRTFHKYTIAIAITITIIEGDYKSLFERTFMNHADRGQIYFVIINTNHTQLLKALSLQEPLNTIPFIGNVNPKTDPAIAGLLLADRFIQGTSLAMVTDSRQTQMAMRRWSFFVVVSNALMYGLLYSLGLLKMALTTLMFAFNFSQFFGASLLFLLFLLAPVLFATFCLLKNLLMYVLMHPAKPLRQSAAHLLKNLTIFSFLACFLEPVLVSIVMFIPFCVSAISAVDIARCLLTWTLMFMPLISLINDLWWCVEIKKLKLFDNDTFQLAHEVWIDRVLRSKIGLFIYGLLTLPVFLVGGLVGFLCSIVTLWIALGCVFVLPKSLELDLLMLLHDFRDILKFFMSSWTEALGFRTISWKPNVIPLSISPTTKSLFDLSKSIIDLEIKTNQRLTPNAQLVCLLRQYLNQGVVVSLFKGKMPHSDFLKQFLWENQQKNFTIEKALYLLESQNLDSSTQLGAIRDYAEYVLLPMEEKLSYTQALNDDPSMAAPFLLSKTIPLLTMEERNCLLKAGASENNLNFDRR